VFSIRDVGVCRLLVYEKPEADVRPFSVVASFFSLLTFSPLQNTSGAAVGTLAEVGKVVESLYVHCK